MLKVIKYKNHGICLRGGEKEEHHQQIQTDLLIRQLFR